MHCSSVANAHKVKTPNMTTAWTGAPIGFALPPVVAPDALGSLVLSTPTSVMPDKHASKQDC